VKSRAIVGKSGPRIDRTDRAMDVQIVGVTMNDRNAPMVAQAKFIEDLSNVCMCLFVGYKSALAFIPRPDEMHRARSDAGVPRSVRVDL
jgi:hypothetical protein